MFMNKNGEWAYITKITDTPMLPDGYDQEEYLAFHTGLLTAPTFGPDAFFTLCAPHAREVVAWLAADPLALWEVRRAEALAA